MNQTVKDNQSARMESTCGSIAGERRRHRGRLVLAALGAGLTVLLAGAAAAQAPAANAGATSRPASGINMVSDGLDTDGSIHLVSGKSLVIATKVQYRRVSIAQPDIADVNPIGPTNVLITARKAGSTQLILWDDQDRSQVVDITVELDLAALRRQIKAAFPDLNINVSALNEALALRGRVPNMRAAEQIAETAGTYGKVHNFLEIGGGQQVMLQVRFAEMSRTANESLGFRAFAGDKSGFQFGTQNGPGATPIGSLARGTGTAVDSTVAVFASGRAGSTAMEFFLQALRENDLLRTLAEPNVIAVSGQEASFLAGGEFPVPVPQSGAGGGTTITIDYREFGVKLNFVPEVLGDGRIRLKVNPEVSDLDFSTAVQIQGFVTPGLTKRRISTTIELADGQTFAIGGLLNNTLNASKSTTPILGDIPILGALFRSVRYNRKETELVVLVTPHLVEPMNPNQVPELPGEHFRFANEFDLAVRADLGGPIHGQPPAAANPAPLYRGTFGYVGPETSAPAATH